MTQHRVLRAAAVATSAAVLLLGLAGCKPELPLPTTTSGAGTATSTPTPSPAPTVPPKPALPVVAGDELLTVTVHAVAPNGSAMDVKLVAHYPIAYNTADGAKITTYLTSIGDTSEITTNPGILASENSTLQILDITATAAGGPAWPAPSGVLLDLGPNNSGAAFGLPMVRAGGTKGSYIITGPGSGNAVTRIKNTGSPDPALWSQRLTYYGMSAWANNPVTLSACTFTLTPKGTNSDTARWDYPFNPGHLYCVGGLGD